MNSDESKRRKRMDEAKAFAIHQAHIDRIELDDHERLKDLDEQGLLDGGEKLKKDLEKYEHERSSLLSLKNQCNMIFDARLEIVEENIKEIKSLLKENRLC